MDDDNDSQDVDRQGSDSEQEDSQPTGAELQNFHLTDMDVEILRKHQKEWQDAKGSARTAVTKGEHSWFFVPRLNQCNRVSTGGCTLTEENENQEKGSTMSRGGHTGW